MPGSSITKFGNPRARAELLRAMWHVAAQLHIDVEEVEDMLIAGFLERRLMPELKYLVREAPMFEIVGGEGLELDKAYAAWQAFCTITLGSVGR